MFSNLVQNLSDESKRSAIKKLYSIYITYPRLDEIMNQITYYHEISKLTGEPQCEFITGISYTGKSKLAKKYRKSHPPIATQEGDTIPVLYVSLPNVAHTRGMAATFLRSLGDPMAGKGSEHFQTNLLYTRLNECGTEMIFVDEFHNLFNRETGKIMQNTASWLKNLINASKKPMVLMGTPGSEEILNSDTELRNRFRCQRQLTPFKWDTLENQTEFRSFLNSLDKMLPLTKRSGLFDEVMALRMYCATGGVVGLVINIIRRATERAILRNEPKLDLHTLAEAYDEYFKVLVADAANTNIKIEYNNSFRIPKYKDLKPEVVMASLDRQTSSVLTAKVDKSTSSRKFSDIIRSK